MNKQRVKMFESDSIKGLEQEVNDFIAMMESIDSGYENFKVNIIATTVSDSLPVKYFFTLTYSYDESGSNPAFL